MTFAAWGRFVHRRRRWVLAASAIFLAAALLALTHGGHLRDDQSAPTESNRASALIRAQLPQPGGSEFSLIFSSRTLTATDPEFQADVHQQLAPLAADPRVSHIMTPYDSPTELAPRLIGADGRRVLAIVYVRDDFDRAARYYEQLREDVRPQPLSVTATDSLALNQDVTKRLASDLSRAEDVSLPVTLVLLAVVFGSLVAALLPLGVALFAVLAALACVLMAARAADVSTYALNIVTLIGLGVSIDYSLFVVSRFREELAAGADVPIALERTASTAGRAVFFSGLTVSIGLAAMLLYRGTFIASLGFAGALVVGLAVCFSLTFLLALLALLGPRLDWLRVRRLRNDGESAAWRRLAEAIMRRPLAALLPAVALILLLATPFQSVRLAAAGVDILPRSAESRHGAELIRSDFPHLGQTAIEVVIDYRGGDPATAENATALAGLEARLAKLANVERVAPAQLGTHVALINAYTSDAPTGDAARSLVRTIRRLAPPPGTSLLVTGLTAADLDQVDYISARAPIAIGLVLLATFALILLLVRSLVLPLKAVVMNLLSIAASFGALVWIFQQGHLSGLLGFTPGSLDPSLPVLLFCIVFGLSMDYEVLMLTRMHEVYVRCGDNRQAVAEGLADSGGLITSAAGIMITVFLAFALADVRLIKAIGLGLAIAVGVDATIVRMIVVPATMRLLGDANWWLPGRFGWRQATAAPVSADAA